MLTAWRVCNFKSVIDETTLSLAPLTLFTGANSAGKSTIIQSMLLTAQTLQSSVITRPVVLNGHMARLGSFTDLVSSGDEDKNITIGFDYSPLSQAITLLSASRRWRPGIRAGDGGAVESVSVSYSFSVLPGPNEGVDKELLKLQPSLVESRVDARIRMNDQLRSETLVIKRSPTEVQSRISDLGLANAQLSANNIDSLKYSVEKAAKRGYIGRLEALNVHSDHVGAYVHHFLPRSLAARYNEVDAQVAWQLSLLISLNAPLRYPVNSSIYRSDIPEGAAALVFSALAPLLVASPDSKVSNYGRSVLGTAIRRLIGDFDASAFSSSLRKLSGQDLSQVLPALATQKAGLEVALRAGREPSYDIEMLGLVEGISAGIDQVQNFFSRSVKYLGPLRDDPKPVYPLAGASDPGDVGFRGEHTAAVLDIHRSTLIEYIPSSCFADVGVASGEYQRTTLAVAVQDWLEYMGVGSDLFTSDLGKLGHELKIKTVGSGLQHDLTQVGVGVSQVLPILVLALLAEPGSTLIFEQPELHLHPRVQSRLADFFVAMTRLHKQCIVETHSEYLVNRLRFRSASDSGDQVAKSCIIYFVEKHENRSLYKKITIDELGSFDNWPEGFFDEGERSSAALLKQGLRKRKAKRS